MTKPKFHEIATGLEFPEGPVAMADGSVLITEIRGQKLSRVSPDGKIATIAKLGGSPNGAAMGPDGKCYVCNSGGFNWVHDPQHGWRGHGTPKDYTSGRIERVDIDTGKVEILFDRSEHGPLRGPNDLVFDRTGGFWFTDSGKVRDNDRDHGAIYYVEAGFRAIRRVIYPLMIPHPNGIALSPDETKLYFAETSSGRVWRFDITSPGVVALKPFPSPNGGALLVGLPGLQLLDSMAVDSGGYVCVATMMERPGITVISPSGDSIEYIPTGDIITTNICFGGDDMRTAYITASAHDRLISMRWPRPGLKLNFQQTR